MKKLMFICAIIMAISLTSCGNNNEIVPENEKQELFGVNKEDVPDPDGDEDELETGED